MYRSFTTESREKKHKTELICNEFGTCFWQEQECVLLGIIAGTESCQSHKVPIFVDSLILLLDTLKQQLPGGGGARL